MSKKKKKTLEDGKLHVFCEEAGFKMFLLECGVGREEVKIKVGKGIYNLHRKPKSCAITRGLQTQHTLASVFNEWILLPQVLMTRERKGYASSMGMNVAIKSEKGSTVDRKKGKANYAKAPTHKHTYLSPQMD